MPEGTTVDPVDLVRRALACDADAQARLYAETDPVVKATVRRCRISLSGMGVPIPLETEEDAASAVHLMLLERAFGLYRGGSLRSFVRHVASCHAKDFFTRRKTGWFGVRFLDDDEEEAPDVSGGVPLIDPTPTPEEQAVAPHLRARMKQALTEREWQCFALWLDHDLTPREIAAALATTSGNVRVTLHASRQKISQLEGLKAALAEGQS